MFKKISENEYIQKFLELWNIPRWRSLIKLGIYFIFFALIIASIDQSNNINTPNTNKVDIIEKYRQMNNYQYIATIKNEISETFIGNVYQNKNLILFNEDSYYYDNKLYKQEESIYKEIEDSSLEFDVWKFTPSFILSLIEKGEFESKTEYADGVVANTYLVNVADFIKLYFGDNTEISDNISITIYQNKERVTKVDLDLTKGYHQSEFANTYDYEVTIEYVSFNVEPIRVDLESSD